MRSLLVTLLLVLPVSLLSQIHFTATLDGSQEVPPVTTTATGTGSFTLSSDLTRLKYVISYQGLSGTLTAGGHFHAAKPGFNGPIVKNIASGGDPASATISGTWSSTDATQPLTPALVESLLTGRLYVNFHTATNPGGQIRGQVNLATGIHFTATLTGAQENPPVATLAGGTGAFVLTPDRNRILWDVTYRQLSGALTAGGHFHVADSGRNGPVVKNIASGGDPASNTLGGAWSTSDVTQPLTPALVDSLIAGKLYVNFHTAVNPGGEIRGQLKMQGGTGFVARLNGAQENPPVTTPATGTGSFSLNDTRNEVKFDITYIGLSGTLTAGAHFHAADSGRNGPVVRGFGTSGDPASGTVSGIWRSTDGQALTPALVESLLTGRVYVNFHTAANPGGEIRGQLRSTTGIGFTSRLDGAQENPPVTTSGSGTGSVVLLATRDTIVYNATYHSLSGPLSGAGGHFHVAPVGVNGPVVKNVAAGAGPASGSVGGNWTTSDATQPLTRALVDSLIAGKIYLNFHTNANPGGEIRGQLRFSSDVVTSVKQAGGSVPSAFNLDQNYPNPFNPSTSVTFQVAVLSDVRLVVFDLLGREVITLVNERLPQGLYTVPFDASAFASGVYFYRLSASTGFMQTKKMLYLR
jgi:hypothetical protein